MSDFIGLNVILIGIIILRKIFGRRISMRLRYALWLMVPVYMLTAPFLNIKSPVNLSVGWERFGIWGVFEETESDRLAWMGDVIGNADQTEGDSTGSQANGSPESADQRTAGSSESADRQAVGNPELTGQQPDGSAQGTNWQANENPQGAAQQAGQQLASNLNPTAGQSAGNVENAEKNALFATQNAETNTVLTTIQRAVQKLFLSKIWTRLRTGVSILLFCLLSAYNLLFWLGCVKHRKFYIRDERTGMHVYTMRRIRSPFLLWNKIYMNSSITEDETTYHYAVLHEYCHFRQGDFFWPVLKYAIFCVYWFDPLIWIAVRLVQRDSELACDEGVVRMIGEENCEEYGSVLLNMIRQSRKEEAYFNISTAMDGRKSLIRERIENLAGTPKRKKWVGAAAVAALLALTGCALLEPQANAGADDMQLLNVGMLSDKAAAGMESASGLTDGEGDSTAYAQNLPVYLTDHLENLTNQKDVQSSYITDLFNGSNHYWIDADHVLWGTGYNEYGQLGTAALEDGRDLEGMHSQPLKIAEQVIHVDCDTNGRFLIYVTEDHQLYGLGANCVCALLRQEAENEEGNDWANIVRKPVLLMDQVAFASAGMGNICALTDNGDAYWWGTISVTTSTRYELMEVTSPTDRTPKMVWPRLRASEPRLMVQNARYVTAGQTAAAAIDEDDTLWIWGSNVWGGCAVTSDGDFVTEPVKAAEHVEMVWVDRLSSGINIFDTEEWAGINPYGFSCNYTYNTFIRKSDGQIYACGIDLSGEEKTVAVFGDLLAGDSDADAGNFTHSYSTEFVPVSVREFTEADSPWATVDDVFAKLEGTWENGVEPGEQVIVERAEAFDPAGEAGQDGGNRSKWYISHDHGALLTDADVIGYDIWDEGGSIRFYREGTDVRPSYYWYLAIDEYGRLVYSYGTSERDMEMRFFKRFGDNANGEELTTQKPIYKPDAPENDPKYAGQGAIPMWYLEHSGVYHWETIKGFQTYVPEDGEYFYVTLLFDDGYYLVTMSSADAHTDVNTYVRVQGPYEGQPDESRFEESRLEEMRMKREGILILVQEYSKDRITGDPIEWLTDNSEADRARARQLGIDPEEDMPGGFYLYNELEETIDYEIDKDCVCQMLDHYGSYYPMDAESWESFYERSGQDTDMGLHSPLWIRLRDGKVVYIIEQYVP